MTLCRAAADGGSMEMEPARDSAESGPEWSN